MMHMTFYWSTSVTLLFNSWKTESWASYSLTLLACVLFSVFYQYMEDRRVRFKALASAADRASSDTIETPLLNTKLGSGGRWSALKFAGAVLFGVNSAIGYLLMLAVMSFNGGVFLAIVGGLAVGYFFFRSGDEETTAVVDNPCACA